MWAHQWGKESSAQQRECSWVLLSKALSYFLVQVWVREDLDDKVNYHG